MAATAPVASNLPPAAAGPAATTPTKASEAQQASDRFLTLLVTQLKNQDPLNPLDNAQVTTQLAQISTVAGIDKLNDTIGALATSFAAGQYLQAVGLVGHEVTVAGSRVALEEGKAAYGLALAKDADAVKVTITDAAGLVVRTIDAGPQKAGVHTFSWDGRNDAGKALPAGTYAMAVAASAKGESVGADPLSIAKVTGVAPSKDGTVVTLGALGTVALADILQVH